MNLILASKLDVASVNLYDTLLELGSWEKTGIFDSNSVWSLTKDYNFFCNKNTQMVMIDELHINAENIDARWEKETNTSIDILAFLSRHKAASGTPSLTVHPIGNWGIAEYGGSDNNVSHTSPAEMSGLLLELNKNAPSDYQVCLEATHHGPYVETPTFFIEIGSSPDRWELKEPAEAIVKSLLNFKPSPGPKLVGIGGGHYAPRFTEALFSHEVCFGHIVANYGLKTLTPKLLAKALSVSSADGIYLHRKGMPKSALREIIQLAEKQKIRIFRQSDLVQR